MTRFERNRIIGKELRKAPIGIKEVCGANLPSFWSKFSNYFEINGENIYLRNAYVISAYDAPELKAARANLFVMINNVKRARQEFEQEKIEEEKIVEKLNNNFMQDLIAAYKKVLEKEMEVKIIRIPCSYVRYDENAIVESYDSKKNICYSPLITTPFNYTTIEDIAKKISSAVIENKQCGLITIKTRRKATEDKIEAFANLMKNIINAQNAYEIAIYEKSKNDSYYRHREDIDV